MSGGCKPRFLKAIFVVEHRRSIRLHSDSIRLHSDGESKLGHERGQAPGSRLAVHAGAAGRENIDNCWNGKTCLRGMSVHGLDNPLTQRPRVRCFCCHPHSAMTCPPGHGPAKSSMAVTFVKMDVDLSLLLPCLRAAKMTTVLCLASSANSGSCHIHEFVEFSMLSPTRGWPSRHDMLAKCSCKWRWRS